MASSPSVNNLVIRVERIELGSDPKLGSHTEYKLQGERCFYEAFDLQRLDASYRSHHTFWRTETVQCDICGEEVDNSEALAQHKEKMHAMGNETPEEEKESQELPEEEGAPAPVQPPRI